MRGSPLLSLGNRIVEISHIVYHTKISDLVRVYHSWSAWKLFSCYLTLLIIVFLCTCSPVQPTVLMATLRGAVSSPPSVEYIVSVRTVSSLS